MAHGPANDVVMLIFSDDSGSVAAEIVGHENRRVPSQIVCTAALFSIAIGERMLRAGPIPVGRAQLLVQILTPPLVNKFSGQTSSTTNRMPSLWLVWNSGCKRSIQTKTAFQFEFVFLEIRTISPGHELVWADDRCTTLHLRPKW